MDAVLAGAGIGFVVGTAAGFLVTYHPVGCDEPAGDGVGTGPCIAAALLGGVLTAGVGAGIGALVRPERWRDVPLPRVSLRLVPHRAAVSLGASLPY